MNNLDAIRSYLVELGADIDTNSIKRFNNALDGIEKRVSGTFKRLGSFIKKAWLPALTIAIVGFTNSIAKSDLEIQKLAKRFFLTDESAKSLKRTLDAMGLDGIEDLQDVALNPELTKQYLELQRLAKELTTGSDVQNNLKEIRALSFEFTKLKLIVSYLFDRVASAIYEKGKPFFKAANQFMKDFNTKFKNNIDWVADKIGTVFSWVLRLAYRVKQVIGAIWGIVQKIISFLNDDMKNLFKGALLGLIAFTHPIIALLALFDDIMTYKEGGNSAFEGIYRFFENIPQKIGGWFSSFIKWIKDFFRDLVRNIKTSINEIWLNISRKINDSSKGFINLGDGLIFNAPMYDPDYQRQVREELEREERELKETQTYNDSHNTTQNLTININGSGDPKSVANNIVSMIRNKQGILA